MGFCCGAKVFPYHFYATTSFSSAPKACVSRSYASSFLVNNNNNNNRAKHWSRSRVRIPGEREVFPVVYCRDTLAAESEQTERGSKKQQQAGDDVDLKSWMHRHGLPPCKVELKERASKGGKHRPIQYVVASEDLQPGDIAFKIPNSLVVTLERVLGNETIAELLTTNKLSELACLALYLMYEKKQGKESFWHPFIRELDRQRGRGQLAVESPLLWSPEDLKHFSGSPMKEVVLERSVGIKREYEELDTVWFMAGSLFKQYPYDIPTEAFPFEIFKQAFVAVQSCVVHLQNVSLARRFALVPLGPPLLAYKSNCKAMLKAVGDFVQLEVDRPYRAGESIVVWCGPQPNQRLLLNYGFVDEDNPYDRLVVQVSLDTKDPLYQDKRIIAQRNGKLSVQTFNIYIGREKEAVFDMLPYLRLAYVSDPSEMQSVISSQGPVCPVSPCTERAVLDQLSGYFRKRLSGYSTTASEDERVLADPQKVPCVLLPVLHVLPPPRICACSSSVPDPLTTMACPAPTTTLHRSSSLSLASQFRSKAPSNFSSRRPRRGPVVICSVSPDKTVVIGLAADSGCGKSTFMRRLTSVFGGAAEPPKGGNPDSNTLISDTTTVICLDDYHSLDRYGRKEKAVTALDPKANNFDLMYEQVKALKEGQPVMKPIYNHVSGLLDPPEEILPPKILVIEGLHPMFDSRVRDLLDFSIYLDISNEVKFAWKIQRDMAERGHSLESIKASIQARKPDFDAYIDTQKQYADVVIQVLPTQLIPDDNEGNILRVKMVMKEGVKYFNPVYLFDEGSTISWIPCGRKLTCSYPGIKFFYGPDIYYDNEVSVVEMDGQFDRLDELIYVESHLSNISTKFYGEVTQQMLKHSDFPGSNNGTGLFQTIVGLKIRDLFEQIISERKTSLKAANV